MAAEAAKCRNPVRRKSLRKKARKAREEFDAGRAAVLPRGRWFMVQWSRSSGSMTKAARTDEWTDKVRTHCDKFHDDKFETPEVQAERISYGRSRGDSLFAVQGGRTRTTVDRVLGAGWKITRPTAQPSAW